MVPEKNTLHTPTPRFLPLDSPFARAPNPSHPPLFAAIMRRTTGIKVLECHAFICKREVAANALVRCCFHAYADSSYARQVDANGSLYGTLNNDRTSNKDKVTPSRKGRRGFFDGFLRILGGGLEAKPVYFGINDDDQHRRESKGRY